MAIAPMALKSSPATANRLRASSPYSSPVRARSVVRRQCQASRSPSNTPSDVFVFPTSITRSISSSSQNFFNRIRSRRRAVLRAHLSSDFSRARSITRVAEQRAKFTRRRLRVVLRAREHSTRARACDELGVVVLVEGVRDDDGGTARTQRLTRRPDAARMHDTKCARQKLSEGRVLEGRHPLGQALSRTVALVADE